MCFGPELAAAAEAVGSTLTTVAPYAAAASTAASVYQNQRAAKAQAEAQSQALEAERTRQQGLQHQADAEIGKVTAQFDPAAQEKALADAQAARTTAATGAIKPIPTDNYQTPTASAPVEVKNDLQRQVSDSLSKATRSAQAQAVLKAFGDQQLGANININRASQRVGQLQNFSQGSSSLVPLDIAAAHAAGNGNLENADIYNVAGSIANLYGNTRKKPTPYGGYPVDGGGNLQFDP